MTDLNVLKLAADNAHTAHEDACTALGVDHWTWVRAVAHMRGENVRRNDDTSRDAELAAAETPRQTWDVYIEKLHAFYLARDGVGGVLGSRGL